MFCRQSSAALPLYKDTHELNFTIGICSDGLRLNTLLEDSACNHLCMSESNKRDILPSGERDLDEIKHYHIEIRGWPKSVLR